jgi:Holliday junction resolvasome RuvABC endonuclease subunit
MNGIGIRVKGNSEVFYSISEKQSSQIIYSDPDVIRIPLSLVLPERLSYLRNNIIDIFNEHNIDYAVIKIAESLSRKNQSSIERNNIEGVIMEAIASSRILEFCTANKNQIKSLLGSTKTKYEDLISGDHSLKEIRYNDGWSSMSIEKKDCILSALSAQKMEKSHYV